LALQSAALRCDYQRVSESETTAADALAELLAGNKRFVSGQSEHPHQDAYRRAELANGQKPFAMILGCSDSRVAAEIIFDRGLGDLFVVRTAGHILDNAVLGSLEFGVEVLHIPLIVVLGHDQCGAVQAAMKAQDSAETPSGYLRDVVGLVAPSVLSARRSGRNSVNEIVAVHAQHTAQLLQDRSALLARKIDAEQCAVVAMEYALVDGRTRVLSSLGSVTSDL
jgi:carbonic anhydrase